MEFVCIVVVDTRSRTQQRPEGVDANREDEPMQYLKDLLDRLGKALGIKSPSGAPTASASTNHFGPVEGPAQDPR
jgi:hypothetical protein